MLLHIKKNINNKSSILILIQRSNNRIKKVNNFGSLSLMRSGRRRRKEKDELRRKGEGGKEGGKVKRRRGRRGKAGRRETSVSLCDAEFCCRLFSVLNMLLDNLPDVVDGLLLCGLLVQRPHRLGRVGF